MKVIKFGGTSVGTIEAILKVKQIIETSAEPVIIVVSALSGVTDHLLEISQLASQGNEQYEQQFRQLVNRHLAMIDGTTTAENQKTLQNKITGLLGELENILRGVYLVKDLSRKTSDIIVSYGERLSAQILATILNGSILYDARKLIQTQRQYKKHIVDFPLTNKIIQQTFHPIPRLAIVPGFIASDKNTGDITNLGRGGSDYTASILAAALQARILEIWTDVDGFMTADPRIISTAYVIDELSYTEAAELCNFGAKVIYPPTIYPAYHSQIPIRIKNTFNPTAKGTYISNRKNTKNGKTIKGISSIADTSLITLQGLGMVGVIGINHRIFKSLSEAGVSVFMVSQASSENNTSFAVRNTDANLAVDILRQEFQQEITQGEIHDIKAEKNLATVAIVGENMKRTPGIAGKLFGTLGRSGISVIACAQGASETNISFVIQQQHLRKALNSIHDSFFLSEYQVMNIFLTGIGTVGGHLLKQISQQQATLMEQNRLKVTLVGVANSRKILLRRHGLNPETCTEELNREGIASSPETIREEILRMNIFNSVFVDCTASAEIAGLYQDFLSHNISVVTANKIANSGPFPVYTQLKETARKTGVKYLFETNVGAGLPIINTMNALTHSGDKILKLQAVLTGTLNFIFNTVSDHIPLSAAIRMAKEAGFSEPDPRIDLSGVDVIRKLVILSREAGYAVNQEDVVKKPFLPESCFEGSLEDFWQTIPDSDLIFEEKRKKIESESKRYRFVAEMDKGQCSVGLQEVDSLHPFYELEGSNNIIMITTERYNEYPMIIKGYGAGAEVTAAGVFSDIISIANIR